MKYLSLLVVVSMLLASCGGAQKSAEQAADNRDQIASLEAELFGADPGKPDRQKALELVDHYLQYAENYPDDSLSSEYLYKASDISMNMGQPVKTIEIFDRLLTRYPEFDKAPTTLFLKAFVYEDQMHDMEQARKYYQLYLEKYPGSEFADDAEVSLRNLGKTPEELIREFEANGQ